MLKMPTDKITYTTKYNRRFFTELIFFQYYRRPGIIILTLGGVLSLLLTVGYLFSWNPFRFHSFPYFSLFYVLFVVVLPVFLKIRIDKAIRNHPFIDIALKFEISSQEVKVSYNETQKIIQWNQLHQVKSLPKTWLFFGTPHSFFYILKSELSNAEQQKLSDWIKLSSKLA